MTNCEGCEFKSRKVRSAASLQIFTEHDFNKEVMLLRVDLVRLLVHAFIATGQHKQCWGNNT